MTTTWLAQDDRPCVGMGFGPSSPGGVAQLVGAVVIPVVAIIVITTLERRYPTTTRRWTSHRLHRVFGGKWVKWSGAFGLVCGLAVFGGGLVWPVQLPDASCANGLGLLASAGLLLTMVSAIWLGLAWAYTAQAGWVALATLFALDVWIVFGMVMMHLNHAPDAPDALLTLAFFMHAVCMVLTTMWAFHARDVSTIGQIRAGEAGRSIAAVWVFLAAYVVVGFFYHEQGLFASTAGGAVVSALTLSALALTMGSGYTNYRVVMHDEAPAVLDD